MSMSASATTYSPSPIDRTGKIAVRRAQRDRAHGHRDLATVLGDGRHLHVAQGPIVAQADQRLPRCGLIDTRIEQPAHRGTEQFFDRVAVDVPAGTPAEES